ncbi:MAG: acyl-ACP--UDP-N-acetylglucosamine O-acyltransferase [Desulfohalobiaceae bacterium]
MTELIHPTAIVDPGARLGQDVQIGPYAVLEAETEIGDGCVIEPFVQIKSWSSLGRNNHVHAHACLGGPPQDLKYQGERSSLVIGDENCIREYVTINRGTPEGGGVTSVGSHCYIMAYAHIAHDCKLGDRVVLANAATLAGHIHIRSDAVIGGLCAVHQFVHIGEYAYIGGMTGVAQDVPPFMLVAGERGWLHGLNQIGLKRHGFSQEQLARLKQAFKLIWRSGLKQEQALQRIQSEMGQCQEIQLLLEFIQQSERGVISPKNLSRGNSNNSCTP